MHGSSLSENIETCLYNTERGVSRSSDRGLPEGQSIFYVARCFLENTVFGAVALLYRFAGLTQSRIEAGDVMI